MQKYCNDNFLKYPESLVIKFQISNKFLQSSIKFLRVKDPSASADDICRDLNSKALGVTPETCTRIN